MFKVDNKKTIRQLSISSFKASRMRNLFAVVAIVLTTVLFTGLFTITSSLLSSIEESTMRQVGGSSHGSFKYLTMEQYDNLKNHPSIKGISYSVVLGIAENKELAKRPSEIRYAYDEMEAKMSFSLPTAGRLPENDDELATDTIVLEQLGIPAELGQKVTLEYSMNGVKHRDTFTLVGFWQGDKLMMASQVWLNQGYVEKQLENYIPADKNDAIGTINSSVNFANSFNIEGKLLKVLADRGYAPDEIAIGINWAYTGNSSSIDAGAVMGGILAILMIVFCGYLIISNVFFISVAKDIRFYGLLKTIGTTGKQIRSFIRRQALLLCAIGVPIGLVVGCAVGALLTPIVLSIINTNVIKVYLNPIAFAAAALFAILTVFISIARPSKIAARVSPMEALRSTDGVQKSNKIRKKSSSVKLWSMAHGNVFRNKKKAILVTISLSLSLIILNSAYSMANSLDMDKYLSNMISSDFAVGDVSHFNVHMDYTNQETLSSQFLTELTAKNGIETMSNIYFAEPTADIDPRLMNLPTRAAKELEIEDKWLENMIQSLQAPELIQHIYGVDENSFGKFTVFSGTIDYDKLATGNYVIAAPYDEEGKLNYYDIGDTVKIVNEEGASKEYEVLAIAQIPYSISNQHTHPITPEFYFASEVFLEDIAKKAPMLTTLDVADQDEAAMEAYLSNYCNNNDSNMDYRSKGSFVAEYENMVHTYQTVGIVLSLLVAGIGIMNFINTIVTSMIARKRELAMLQSIGMTIKQTQKMLVYEGLVYTVLTAIFALTMGSVLGSMGVSAISGGASYLSSYFTVAPSLICLPVLAFISILVPYISGKTMNKNSLVERLRESE